MKKSEFLEKIQSIGTLEDVVQIREQLATLSNDVSTDYDNIDTLTQQNQQLTQDNEMVRAANMKLWLQLGDDKSPEERQKDNTGIDQPEPKEIKDSYMDLFNKKGEY